MSREVERITVTTSPPAGAYGPLRTTDWSVRSRLKSVSGPCSVDLHIRLVKTTDSLGEKVSGDFTRNVPKRQNLLVIQFHTLTDLLGTFTTNNGKDSSRSLPDRSLQSSGDLSYLSYVQITYKL